MTMALTPNKQLLASFLALSAIVALSADVFYLERSHQAELVSIHHIEEAALEFYRHCHPDDGELAVVKSEAGSWSCEKHTRLAYGQAK